MCMYVLVCVWKCVCVCLVGVCVPDSLASSSDMVWLNTASWLTMWSSVLAIVSGVACVNGCAWMKQILEGE